MFEVHKKRRIGFNVGEESPSDSFDFIGRKRKIGFNVGDGDEVPSWGTPENFGGIMEGLFAKNAFSLNLSRNARLFFLCILGALSVSVFGSLSMFAEKKTQDGKALLTAGTLGVPLVKVEMKANSSTDFEAKTPLSDRFREMAKNAQERKNKIGLFPRPVFLLKKSKTGEK